MVNLALSYMKVGSVYYGAVRSCVDTSSNSLIKVFRLVRTGQRTRKGCNLHLSWNGEEGDFGLAQWGQVPW